MTRKLYIKTYGCQMNVYDSDRMADVLAPLGYRLSQTPDDADLVILNTCHIREKAEEKMYSDLGRIRRRKREMEAQGRQMLVAVGGCVGQAEGGEIIRRAPYVDMVFGPQSYHKLPEMIDQALSQGGGVVDLEFPAVSKFDSLPEPGYSGSGSAFLSVQEGCDKFCTFCVVPYTRGAEYSRPAADILQEARGLAASGVREITLLGQNVNAYHGQGPEGGEWRLAALMRVLARVPGIERLRYMTSHPSDMDEELIALHGEEKKMMPYLHLPVQSGSDAILKRMNRRHDAAFYLDIIDRLRRARPDIALSSDFIVGFPGETDEDFRATMRLAESVSFAQAYSFKYSPRPGTPAATQEAQVPEEVKTERLALLQGLLMRQQAAFNRTTLGKSFEVLLERPGKLAGQMIGKSPYMQSLHVRDAAHLAGCLVRVTVTEAHPSSLAGELVARPENSVQAALPVL